MRPTGLDSLVCFCLSAFLGPKARFAFGCFCHARRPLVTSSQPIYFLFNRLHHPPPPLIRGGERIFKYEVAKFISLGTLCGRFRWNELFICSILYHVFAFSLFYWFNLLLGTRLKSIEYSKSPFAKYQLKSCLVSTNCNLLCRHTKMQNRYWSYFSESLRLIIYSLL